MFDRGEKCEDVQASGDMKEPTWRKTSVKITSGFVHVSRTILGKSICYADDHLWFQFVPRMQKKKNKKKNGKNSGETKCKQVTVRNVIQIMILSVFTLS